MGKRQSILLGLRTRVRALKIAHAERVSFVGTEHAERMRKVRDLGLIDHGVELALGRVRFRAQDARINLILKGLYEKQLLGFLLVSAEKKTLSRIGSTRELKPAQRTELEKKLGEIDTLLGDAQDTNKFLRIFGEEFTKLTRK